MADHGRSDGGGVADTSSSNMVGGAGTMISGGTPGGMFGGAGNVDGGSGSGSEERGMR
jgi:hypothetical protein